MARKRIGLLAVLLILLNTLLILEQPGLVFAEIIPPLLTYQDSIDNGNINIREPETTTSQQLTSSGKISSWEWSPNGSRLAFIVAESGLTVANADGSNKNLVGKNAVRFVWSPDGAALVFQTESKDNPPEVYVVKADGSQQVKLPAEVAPDFNGLFWSPSGNNLLFAKPTPDSSAQQRFYKRDLYSVNQDGSGFKKLFTFFGQLYGYWPDGQRVLIGETREDDGPGLGISRVLTLRKLDGNGRQTLGEREYVLNDEFRLEPGGKRILINSSGPTKAVAEVANPGAYKILPTSGQNEAILATSWSNEAGKIIAIVSQVRSGSKPTYQLEEFNLSNNSRRTLVALDFKEVAAGDGPLFSVDVEATGVVFVHCSRCVSQALHIFNLQTGKLSTNVFFNFFYNFRWRPNLFVKARPEFYRIWEQSDAAVILGLAKNRSWLWGPTGVAMETENFAEGIAGKRRVQYFDKARMEITDPEADRGKLFFVTNGLLPKELISGQLQSGLDQFENRQPAEVNVAGDPNGSITYAKLKPYVTLKPGENVAPNRVGAAVTDSLEKDGTLKEAPAFPTVKLGQFVPETGHNIADVFITYFKTLPQDWLFVMGYPISEPYQAVITLNGTPTPAIIQVFERRVLTYTPSNADPYKVEQGNVGLHYYQWRYNK